MSHSSLCSKKASGLEQDSLMKFFTGMKNKESDKGPG